jgi:ArsR family transcriptional regulator, arsenate/arsenite/antimonite-responsive transcriptional repressor
MELSIAVRALAALAQETRLKIFRYLVVEGHAGSAVGQIGTALDIAPATLSFHLKELANAGLITARQDGRYIFYSANFDEMNGLLTYLQDNCCAGHPELCRPAANDARASKKASIKLIKRRAAR